MEIVLPQSIITAPTSDWLAEKSGIQCACGNIIYISSCKTGHGEKLCSKCHLMYEFWNNLDGSGLRLSIKGYFPFYSSGYKFALQKNES